MDPTFKLFGKMMCGAVVILGGLRLVMDSVFAAKPQDPSRTDAPGFYWTER